MGSAFKPGNNRIHFFFFFGSFLRNCATVFDPIPDIVLSPLGAVCAALRDSGRRAARSSALPVVAMIEPGKSPWINVGRSNYTRRHALQWRQSCIESEPEGNEAMRKFRSARHHPVSNDCLRHSSRQQCLSLGAPDEPCVFIVTAACMACHPCMPIVRLWRPCKSLARQYVISESSMLGL